MLFLKFGILILFMLTHGRKFGMQDPSKFAVAAVAVSADAGGGGGAQAAAKVEEKKEESDEEDYEGGFGLFDEE